MMATLLNVVWYFASGQFSKMDLSASSTAIMPQAALVAAGSLLFAPRHQKIAAAANLLVAVAVLRTLTRMVWNPVAWKTLVHMEWALLYWGIVLLGVVGCKALVIAYKRSEYGQHWRRSLCLTGLLAATIVGADVAIHTAYLRQWGFWDLLEAHVLYGLLSMPLGYIVSCLWGMSMGKAAEFRLFRQADRSRV